MQINITSNGSTVTGEDHGHGKYNISRSVHDVDNQLEADGRTAGHRD